jgi:hypothetical protein
MSMDLIADRANIGYRGATFISDTQAHTGAWRKVVTITATVFAVCTDALRGGNTFTGVSIPAGVEILGDMTAITLTSGSCIAYM